MVQDILRSSMLVPPESSSAVLVMIRCKFVSICNRSHTKRFLRRYPSLMPSFEESLQISWHKLYSGETRNSTLLTIKNPESILPGLESVPGRDGQTNGGTDRIVIAVARKNRSISNEEL